MAKSIAMMADEILGGALTNTAENISEVVGTTHFPSPEQGELPSITDETRSQLLENAMVGMNLLNGDNLEELDLSQKSERDPEQVRKKAEYDEKHREKRNQQKGLIPYVALA